MPFAALCKVWANKNLKRFSTKYSAFNAHMWGLVCTVFGGLHYYPVSQRKSATSTGACPEFSRGPAERDAEAIDKMQSQSDLDSEF